MRAIIQEEVNTVLEVILGVLHGFGGVAGDPGDGVDVQPGGVQPTIDLWEQYVPARDKLSPCVVAMVALDGPLRFTNIWAYESLNARSQARADAVAQGIWPPKGGPAHLTTDMVSTIAMPAAVSPLK